MATSGKDPLVWIDLELTGLDDQDEILEIHCIVTDGQLDPISPPTPSPDTTPASAHPPGEWGAVLHCSPERLAQMNEWCRRTHGASGLTAACAASTTTPEAAAAGLRSHLLTHLGGPEAASQALLAGNSVHTDRAALRRSPHFRPIVEMLHYRILDVSSLKEAARRWCGDEVLRGVPRKTLDHRARGDILESIAEARYYRDAVFARAKPLSE